jgi:hypothetical protein
LLFDPPVATKTHAFLQPKTHAFLQHLPPGVATKTQQKRNKNAIKLHTKMLHYLTIIVTITPVNVTKTQPKRNQNASKTQPKALQYFTINATQNATKTHAFL